MPVNVSARSRRPPSYGHLGLNAEQQRVARKIIAQGQAMHAPRKVIKVALATALVEANLQNPHWGDADSQGAFQQRPSQGWGSPAQVTNVRYAARQFFSRAIPLFHQGHRGGALAQAVQRSAFPERYAQHLGEAGRILTKMEGGAAPVGKGSYQIPGGKGGKGVAAALGLGDIPTSQAVQRLVSAQPALHDLPSKAAMPAYPTTSAPMARAVQPGQTKAGTSQLQATSPGSTRTPFQGRTETVNEPIPGGIRKAMLAQLLAQQPGGGKDKGGPKGGKQPGAAGQPQGKVILASGADRSGVRTRPVVLNFVREISGLAGHSLTIGTGTNHSQMTTTGNVSDHWSGHAADIPASGQALTRLGRLALIAAGANPKWAKRQRGGVFNINGHQIIFNSMVGGNHFNHLHVSAYR